MPELEKVPFLLRVWRFNICSGIDRVKLASTDRVKQNFGGFLNALEEAVVLITSTCSSLLVRMMFEDLLAVGLLDLFGGSSPSVFAKTEHSVVILALDSKWSS